MGPTCSEINDHLFFQLKLAKPLIKVYALISVRVSAEMLNLHGNFHNDLFQSKKGNRFIKGKRLLWFISTAGCLYLGLISGDRSTELLLAGAARRPHDQREKVKDEDRPVTSKPPARFIF